MPKKIIIAGGGTGGHIFPAVAVANAIKAIDPSNEILFVGAKGKMEMEKVPAAGYAIRGLDIAGFNRSQLWKNIGLPFKLVKSFLQTRSIFKDFNPDAAFGVGGYSSFPVLRFAQQKGIPTYLHESNAFAGKSNVLLGNKSTRVFTGTQGMEKFFPANKIMVTGNPVRGSIVANKYNKKEAKLALGFDPERLLLMVVGGSQGALSINKQVLKLLPMLRENKVQLLWQTGAGFFDTAKDACSTMNGMHAAAFIHDMAQAYAAADLVISRSGAMSVAELAISGKAVVFVPFPFAAEDHQTFNASQLANAGAATLVKDSNMDNALWPALQQLITSDEKRSDMAERIKAFAITGADEIIAKTILQDLNK